ncbi:MAG: hypothetical protein ACTHK7_24485 [Aureliella sp.]
MRMNVCLRFTICVLISAGATALAQDSTDSKPQASANAASGSESGTEHSAQIRAHMRRVQDQFDQMNDSTWYRVAFVATLSEIREFEPGDKVIGRLATGKTDVAVLRVRAVGQQKGVDFKESSVIVCPIGKSRALWERCLHQRAEMVFEYNRIGETEFVLKFGC